MRLAKLIIVSSLLILLLWWVSLLVVGVLGSLLEIRVVPVIGMVRWRIVGLRIILLGVIVTGVSIVILKSVGLLDAYFGWTCGCIRIFIRLWDPLVALASCAELGIYICHSHLVASF